MTQWKLVPCEPTEEMIKTVNTADCHNFELSWAEGYKAMLAAAPQTEANARLIAAAPDLLAFVEEYIYAFESGMAGESYLHRIAKTAITKATGETV